MKVKSITLSTICTSTAFKCFLCKVLTYCMLAGITAGDCIPLHEGGNQSAQHVCCFLFVPHSNKQFFTVDLKHIFPCLPPYRSVASVNWIFLFFTVIHSDILICLSPFQLLASFSLLKRAFKSATYHWHYNYTDMKNSSIYFKQTLYHDKVAVIWCFQSVLAQRWVNQIPFKVNCNL